MGRSLLGVHFGTHCIHPMYFGECFFFFKWNCHLPTRNRKRKCICRLDLKIPAFGFKIIRFNQCEEFIVFVVCELYLSFCLLG